MLQKKCVGLFVLCLIFGSSYIAWLQKEVKLGQKTINTLKLVPAYDFNIKQESFFYANGFDAMENIEPLQLGKQSYDLDWRLYKEDFNTKKIKSQFPRN